MRHYVDTYRMPEKILIRRLAFDSFKQAKWFYEQCCKCERPKNPKLGEIWLEIKLVVWNGDDPAQALTDL